MAGTNEQRDLLPIANSSCEAIVVNDRCLVRTQDGHRIVVAAGVALSQYAVGDRMAEAHAMVSRIRQGRSRRTVRQERSVAPGQPSADSLPPVSTLRPVADRGHGVVDLPRRRPR